MGSMTVSPVVCARCGSQDAHWLGQTQASVFVRCSRCKDVWRLDPQLDRERIILERLLHSAPSVPARAGAA
jgi:hypothetical protein